MGRSVAPAGGKTHGFSQCTAGRCVTGADLGHYGHRCVHYIPHFGHCGPHGGWFAVHRCGSVCGVVHRRGQPVAGHAGSHSCGDGGGPCHRPAAHSLRYSGHSGGHSDAAGAVFHQHGHHGHESHSGYQCDHQRNAGQAAGVPALRYRCGQRKPPVLAAPHLCGRPVHAGDHCGALLVLRHRAGLFAARHGRQRKHGPRTGDQHQLCKGSGPCGLQRPGGAFRRSSCPIQQRQ